MAEVHSQGFVMSAARPPDDGCRDGPQMSAQSSCAPSSISVSRTSKGKCITAPPLSWSLFARTRICHRGVRRMTGPASWRPCSCHSAATHPSAASCHERRGRVQLGAVRALGRADVKLGRTLKNLVGVRAVVLCSAEATFQLRRRVWRRGRGGGRVR